MLPPPPLVRPIISPPLRALGCERGSTLVGCSSLVLLVAIAAIALLHADFGIGASSHPHPTRVLSPD